MEFVSLRGFVLTWRDVDTDHEQSLGDLSTNENNSPPCFLVLGANDSGEYLLFVHLPLKINDNYKGLRNTYMIAESIDTEDASASTDLLQITHDPQEYPVLERTGVETGARLIWARFVLKKPLYVVMPVGKAQKPVNIRSQGLLRSLKSLSQATSFELYVRDLGPNAGCIRTFLRTLCSGAARNPRIDHKSTFNGRPWGMNPWKLYKLRDDETLQEGWNPIFDERPPSYQEAVQSSSKQGGNASVPDHLKSSHHSSKGTSGPKTFAALEDPEEGNEGRCEAADAIEGPLEGNDSSQENPIPPDTAQDDREVRENSEETILLEDRARSGDDECFTPAEHSVQGPQHDRLRKRDAREANLDAMPSSSHSNPTVRPEPSDRRTTKVHKRIPFAIHEDAARHRAAMEQQASEDWPLRIITEKAAHHAASVLASGPNRGLFDDAQFRWFCDAVLWLAMAWRRNHSVHRVYLEELRMLCRCIWRRDRRAFQSTRIRCMATFVRKERTSQDTGPFAYALEDRTTWMVDFIYNEFGPGYDTMVVDELTALHESTSHWMQVGGDTGPTGPDNEVDYALRENGSHFQMAACLLVVCYIRESYEGDAAPQEEPRVRRAEPVQSTTRARTQSAGL